MIKLDVQEYCHGCANFTADVKEPEKYYAGLDIIEMTDTLVRCEHRKLCENLTSSSVLAAIHGRYLRTCTLMIGISGMTINLQIKFYIFAMADSVRLVQMNVITQLILTMPKTLIRNLACM